jgi:hypothetical protein
MNKDVVIISGIAILAITAIEIVALLRGIDGTILAGALTVIGGIAGYQIKKVRTPKS